MITKIQNLTQDQLFCILAVTNGHLKIGALSTANLDTLSEVRAQALAYSTRLDYCWTKLHSLEQIDANGNEVDFVNCPW